MTNSHTFVVIMDNAIQWKDSDGRTGTIPYGPTLPHKTPSDAIRTLNRWLGGRFEVHDERTNPSIQHIHIEL